MPDLTVPITDEEMHALRTLTPSLTTPEKMASELLGQSIQSGLDQLIDSLLESWVSLLSISDLETMEHTRRVTEFTVRLATRMVFSDRSLVHIRRGALLHDIGKLIKKVYEKYYTAKDYRGLKYYSF
jgi:response regulator RpfG family c-di-GMP phosphodiesterase